VTAVGVVPSARIMVRRSTDGLSWTEPPFIADDAPTPGHQFMPSLLFHAGRVSLAYYDLTEDHTVGVMSPDPGDPSAPLTETREPAGDLASPAQPGKVFEDFVRDVSPPPFDPVTNPLKRRHTLDVRVAEALPAAPGTPGGFTSTRISQYVFGDDPASDRISQFQYNPGGLPIFACKGELANCKAFIGDYIDQAGAPDIIPDGLGGWKRNIATSAARVVHTITTDNRDVRPPPPGKTWADYTPPQSPFSQGLGAGSLFDPTQPRPPCVDQGTGFTTAGMRNQNLYTSRLTQGLVASSPHNSKPLGYTTIDGHVLLLQRAFVVLAQNTTDVLKTFRLTIANQPPDAGTGTGKASFLQFPAPPLPDPLTELFLNVPAKSTATRTVFVTSAVADASVSVLVEEFSGLPADGGVLVPPSAGGLLDTVVLNPDITNPDITNPDITNPDITNPDITNAEVYNPDITNPDITNPDITNPDITNPDITNPDITNPDITNPDITNVQVFNPDITNPDITNPDITNPDITNPDITNPDITNPDITNGSVAEGTWTVEDDGNTSGGYKVKLLVSDEVPDDFKTQLVIHRGHSTPVAVGCDLAVQRQPILVANIPNPAFTSLADGDLAALDTVNPDITNANLYVGPGGDWAQITLRVLDTDPAHGITPEQFLTTSVTPVIVAHGVNTVEAAQGSQTPPIAIPGTTIVFLDLPALGTAGVPLTPIVRVQARDTSGAVLPGVVITLSFGSNPTGAILTGNVAVSNVTGIAQFPNLTIDRAGVGYRLLASAGNLPPSLSAPFTILPAPPAGFTKIWVGREAASPTSWTGAANWNPPGAPTSTDDAYIAPANSQPVLTASESIRKLTVATGASLALGVFTINASGDVDVSGAMTGTGVVRMVPGQLARLSGNIPGLQVEGPVTTGGPLTVAGNLGVFKTGQFDVADQVVQVNGNLTTFGAGTLRMTSGSGLLDVAGNADFAGGSTAGLLTDGTLRITGNFNQDGGTSTESFAASANHRTILEGLGGSTVQFDNPGDTAATSHFHTLRLDESGDLSLLSDVYGIGPLVTIGPTPPIVLGGGHRLVFQGLNVFRLILDDAPLVSNFGLLQRFDDVTFQNYRTNTPLTIIHPGQAAPFTMDGLAFGLPTSQFVLEANDQVLGNPLFLELTGASPAAGCSFVNLLGEADASWNGTPCRGIP
jgi:hypothetical protein